MQEMTQPRGKKFGPYITLKLIGSGAQSAVFAAIHEETGRTVALRVMTMTVKDIAAAIRECQDVLQSMTTIQAPHIVETVDYGQEGSSLYIAMNVMNGGSLADRMRVRWQNPMPDLSHLPSPRDVLTMLSRIAETLDSLHQLGMVHGQIGPRSLMFNDKGEAFLSDMGLTRLMKIIYKLEVTNSFNMNKYSAPELWDGERPSPATDQYALACIVYELLTGKPPFDDTSIYNLMQAHMNDVAPPPHYIRKTLPGDLAMIFWQALAKPTDRRYSSIMAFYSGLSEALGDTLGQPTDFFTFRL